MSICSNCFPSFLQTSCWNYYGVIKRNNVFYLPGVVSHKWPLALASCAKNLTPFKCQISYDINCPWFVCLYVIACHILIRSQKHIVQCLEDLFFLFFYHQLLLIMMIEPLWPKEALFLLPFPPFALKPPYTLLHDIWYREWLLY